MSEIRGGPHFSTASAAESFAAAGRTGLFDLSAALRAAEGRGETLEQLLDRNVSELLQELRVAFTGVQVLFAFLLGLSFTQRFHALDRLEIAVYVVALLSTALATMMFIAPVSLHRIVFRRRQKAALVILADRFLVIGLALLGLAITSAVLLTLDVVLGLSWAVIGSAVTAVVALLTWYAVPLLIRRGGHGLAPPGSRTTDPDRG